MRALVVHPGAAWATHDVHMGVVDGLREVGVPVAEFRLDSRINRQHDFLHYLWRRQKRQAPETAWPKPTPMDVLFQASGGLIERALERRCTDVIVVSAMFLMPDRIELARRAGLRVWLLCTETPYAMTEELRLAAAVDGVWTHERAALEAFRAVNPRVAYLPHAWRAGVHDAPTPPAEIDADVLFVGSLFPERIAFLSAIDWSGVRLALYGTPEMLPARSSLRAAVRGKVVPNVAVPGLARRAHVTLNLFRAPEAGIRAESLNPRAYEMAAASVCMVSDERLEVGEVFGASVPTFRTPAEAEALIRALVADPVRRRACAEGARVAVQGQTWTDRAARMVADVQRWTLADGLQRSA